MAIALDGLAYGRTRHSSRFNYYMILLSSRTSEFLSNNNELSSQLRTSHTTACHGRIKSNIQPRSNRSRGTILSRLGSLLSYRCNNYTIVSTEEDCIRPRRMDGLHLHHGIGIDGNGSMDGNRQRSSKYIPCNHRSRRCRIITSPTSHWSHPSSNLQEKAS